MPVAFSPSTPGKKESMGLRFAGPSPFPTLLPPATECTDQLEVLPEAYDVLRIRSGP